MTQNPIPSHYDMGRRTRTPGNRQPFADATRTPRILLAPRWDGRRTVDGAWWPWTTNLTAELHDLATVLTLRLGPVARFAYEWNPISAGQRLVDEPDGIALTAPIPGQPANTMYVSGENGTHMVLAVLPPGTVADRGYDAMRRIVDDSRSG
ncbi:DUF5994 family protein [Rhodococcus gannanensis]|uniref:DUF5994 family protein n=1 Tax=Rhodococcus gannanensis TaxID=1960308 RepID=A0ABW4NZF9_9NOCA